MSGEYLVIRPREGWIRQAREASDALQASGALTLGDFAAVDYTNFCLLIEALHALGQPVSHELMERAQMRPVGDVLGEDGEA